MISHRRKGRKRFHADRRSQMPCEFRLEKIPSQEEILQENPSGRRCFRISPEMNTSLFRSFNINTSANILATGGPEKYYHESERRAGYDDHSLIGPYSWVAFALATIGYSVLLYTIRKREKDTSFFYQFLVFDSILEWSLVTVQLVRLQLSRIPWTCWMEKSDVCDNAVHKCGFRLTTSYGRAVIQAYFWGIIPAVTDSAVWCSIVIGIDRTLAIWFPLWYRAHKPFKKTGSKITLVLFFSVVFTWNIFQMPMITLVEQDQSRNESAHNVVLRNMTEYTNIAKIRSAWLLVDNIIQGYVRNIEPALLVTLWLLILLKLLMRANMTAGSVSTHQMSEDRARVVSGFFVMTLTTIPVGITRYRKVIQTRTNVACQSIWHEPVISVEDYESCINQMVEMFHWLRITDYTIIAYAINFYVLYLTVPSFRKKVRATFFKSTAVAPK